MLLKYHALFSDDQNVWRTQSREVIFTCNYTDVLKPVIISRKISQSLTPGWLLLGKVKVKLHVHKQGKGVALLGRCPEPGSVTRSLAAPAVPPAPRPLAQCRLAWLNSVLCSKTPQRGLGSPVCSSLFLSLTRILGGVRTESYKDETVGLEPPAAEATFL